MSKAFTKEENQQVDEELEKDDDPALPQGTKNYMTPQGAEKLRAELKKLLNETRPEITAVVQWAAGNGDRSENADYIYGKKRLREIDRRIRFLTKRLESAEIVDPAQQKSDRVHFGATVTIKTESDEEKIYSIVGIDETDVKSGRISWISPLAKTLLNHKVGEWVTLKSPKGEEEFKILAIKYLALD
jgi:transcription elongation factor GreB